jgi:hypothetical protein
LLKCFGGWRSVICYRTSNFALYYIYIDADTFCGLGYIKPSAYWSGYLVRNTVNLYFPLSTQGCALGLCSFYISTTLICQQWITKRSWSYLRQSSGEARSSANTSTNTTTKPTGVIRPYKHAASKVMVAPEIQWQMFPRI